MELLRNLLSGREMACKSEDMSSRPRIHVKMKKDSTYSTQKAALTPAQLWQTRVFAN